MILSGASLTFATTYQSIASDNWSVTTTWTPNGTPASGDTVVVRNHDVVLTSSTTINDLKTWGGGGGFGSLTITNATLTTGTTPDYLAMTANMNSSVIINSGAYNPGLNLQIQSGAADNHNSTLILNSGSSLTTGGTGGLLMNAGSGSTNTVVLNGGSTLSVQYIDFNNLGDASTFQQILINDGTLTLRASAENNSFQFDDVDASIKFEGGSIVFEGVDSEADFTSFQAVFNNWVNNSKIISTTFSDQELKDGFSFDGSNAVLSLSAAPPPVPPKSGQLSIATGVDSVSVTAIGLEATATNTLQVKTNLLAESWDDVSVSTGSTSNSWVITPLPDQKSFYRVLSQ